MTTQGLRFIGLSASERKAALPLDEGDRVEVRVKRRGGDDRTVALPPEAAALVEALVGRLLDGERVTVLSDEQELSPNEVARLLGVSRPLAVHRMEIGDLPFRYVGKHRRAKLKDVLALKARLDAQSEAMRALADDALDLEHRHGA
jgi:hypothetical protein